MGLFKKKGSGPVKTISKEELYRKEKAKEPMTYDELQMLNREKSKDLSNQILRIAGLFAVLFIVILAVGCFLYPFSIFNLFGKTKFWDCYNHFRVYTGGDWRNLRDVIAAVMRGSYPDGAGIGFIDVFYMMGGWTIPVIATIGLILIVIYAAYVVAYNIRDLINVIKHFFSRTAYIVTDIASASKESIDSTKDGEKKKTTKKKSTKKLPEEIKEAINEVPAPDAEEGRREETIGGYTTEQLDALLRGEALPEEKKESEKSLF